MDDPGLSTLRRAAVGGRREDAVPPARHKWSRLWHGGWRLVPLRGSLDPAPNEVEAGRQRHRLAHRRPAYARTRMSVS